jgi:hypothetical protein
VAWNAQGFAALPRVGQATIRQPHLGTGFAPTALRERTS